MPTARLLAQKANNRFALLAVVAALTLTLLTTTNIATACPGPPPKSLRMLYMTSDLIVVARVGRTTPVELIGTAESGTKSYLMKTDLRVSSTVKGQSNDGVVHVYHMRWGFGGDASNDEVAEHLFSQCSDGDKLLVFLSRRGNGEGPSLEGYELADSSSGIKHLVEADLKVYIQRIDELTLILQQEKPDPSQIVEWLVRCIEEPATRWEGAFELIASNTALRRIEEKENAVEEQAVAESNVAAADAGKEAPAGDQPGTEAAGSADTASGTTTIKLGDAGDEQIVELPLIRRGYFMPGPEFARLLTAAQKSRISNALFNTKDVTYNEISLIELVQEWGDPRLVPFALSQLRGFVSDPPYMAEALVSLVADSFDNEELTKIAEKYCENSAYNDDEQEESTDVEAEAATEEETTEEGQEEKTEIDAIENSFEQSLGGNSTQKRSKRLQRFLARVESITSL